MTISFLILVNKQGQTRLAKYFGETLNTDEKRALEGEIVRKCLARTDKQCSFFDHRQYKVVYRRYASLFFMVGVDDEEVSPIAWMIQARMLSTGHGTDYPAL
jgi:AP-4 complex subunit sigma-1